MLKRIGLGALIWAIMFVWISIVMFVFKLETGTLYYVLAWLGTVVAAWFVAGKAEIKDIGDGFMTALIFVVVGLLLDWLVTTKFNGEIFTLWGYWVSYGLLLLVPILKGSMKK